MRCSSHMPMLMVCILLGVVRLRAKQSDDSIAMNGLDDLRGDQYKDCNFVFFSLSIDNKQDGHIMMRFKKALMSTRL